MSLPRLIVKLLHFYMRLSPYLSYRVSVGTHREILLPLDSDSLGRAYFITKSLKA